MDLKDYLTSSVDEEIPRDLSSNSSLGSEENVMSNNPFHLLRDDDSTVASGRRSSGMSLRSRASGAGFSSADPTADTAEPSTLDSSVLDASLSGPTLSDDPTPSKLPPPPTAEETSNSNLEEDNSLISSVVTAHLKQRSCAVAPLTEAASSSSNVEDKDEEGNGEDENVYMMLFSPDTTKEIKKARARVMKEEAEKKAALPPSPPPPPHSTSQVRFHDSTTFLQSPTTSSVAANIMRNLDSAKKAVNASSKSLAERLIGISEKRKIHLSRRRNSIKEKTILAANSLVLTSPGYPNFGNTSVNASFKSTAPRLSTGGNPKGPKMTVKPFKARPLPNSTGDMGAGGQFGVPKINKRQATVPKSPMLGARRKSMRLNGAPYQPLKKSVAKASKPNPKPRPTKRSLPPSSTTTTNNTTRTTSSSSRPVPRVAKVTTKATEAAKATRYSAASAVAYQPKRTKRSGIDPYKPFKARPLPNSNSDVGSGGQFGVPKIPKRPPTVPKAPVLGVVRNAGEAGKGKLSIPNSTVSSLTSASGLSSNNNNNNNKDKHFVKPTALNALPFDRNVGGSSASNARLQAQITMIEEKEEEERRQANAFKARPMPATTLAPEVVIKKGTVSYLSDASENVHPNASGSLGEKAPNLKSTVRARQRAMFEARKARSQRARQAKMEMARAQLKEAEGRELEGLREQIRMPR